MTAFSAALDLMFTDPNLSCEAWHRDSEGQFTRIRVIQRRPDEVSSFGSARVLSDTLRIDVRVSELAWPRPDEQIILEDETFLIQGEPVRDRDRLIWTIEAAPA